MILTACLILMVGLLAYTFWPERRPSLERPKSRLDFLLERKDVLYENLRDLAFEYRSGKYPLEDYTTQRGLLEEETAAVVAEIETLEQVSA